LRRRKFSDNPDNAPEKQVEYKAEIAVMTDDDLLKEAEQKIWLSTYANNNPISCYHWQVDAIYAEVMRRNKPELYDRAYKRAMASC